jgi:peptidoglycan/LPS O-acetylase OafA/YrhL
MSEWWTYRLSDFLMFAPDTYWRLVERYNRELWPLQAVALAAGALLLVLAARPRPWTGRAVAAVLALSWLWVGWAFHGQRYATINWAAQYLAAAFVLQAALLAGVALFARAGDRAAESRRVRTLGGALAAAGVLLYPLLAPALGRPWAQAEVFALMPEPTALATLGLLLATSGRQRTWLAAIPVVSLAVGGATAWLLAR